MSDKENAEEKAAPTYYDFRIERINTRAQVTFDETGCNGRSAWMGRAFIDVERIKLLESDGWCQDNPYAAITLAVEDNGASGDGMWIKAVLGDTGQNFANKDGGDLFCISMTPKQARLLAEALLVVGRLRG